MNLLNKTGLTYFWGKLKAYFAKGNGKIFYGTCDTAGATAAKVVTCSAFSSADLDNGTLLIVKFINSNSATAADVTLNVNSTGANEVRMIRNSEATTMITSGQIRATTNAFMFNKSLSGSTQYWLLISSDTDTTYSTMTQTNINDGTSTTGMRLTPKLLRDNFYTETEIDTMMGDKKIWAGTQAAYDLLTPDSDTLYFITESSS